MDPESAMLERLCREDPSNVDVARRLFLNRERCEWSYQGLSIASWIQQSLSDRASERERALQALREIGPSAWAPAFDLACSHAWFPRRRGLELLSEISPELARPLILRALGDPVDEVRASALELSRRLGLQSPQELAARLLELCGHESRAIQAFALNSLRHTPGDAKVLDSIERALADPDLGMRSIACQVARHHGREALPLFQALRERLSDAAWAVRRDAALAIAELGSDASAAIPEIIALLLDHDWDVRQAAVQSLMAFDEVLRNPAVDPLVAWLGHELREHRHFAMRSLVQLAPSHPDTLPALLSMVEESGVSERVALAELLRVFPADAPRVLETLLQLFDDYDPEVRSAACDTIIQHGNSEEAIPILGRWHQAEHRRDRAWAAYALASLTASCQDSELRRVSIEQLIGILKESELERREAACAGCEHFSDSPPGLLKALSEVLQGDPCWAPRIAAARALRNGGVDAFPALIAGCRDRDPDVRAASLRSILPMERNAQVTELLFERLLANDRYNSTLALFSLSRRASSERAVAERLYSLYASLPPNLREELIEESRALISDGEASPNEGVDPRELLRALWNLDRHASEGP